MNKGDIIYFIHNKRVISGKIEYIYSEDDDESHDYLIISDELIEGLFDFYCDIEDLYIKEVDALYYLRTYFLQELQKIDKQISEIVWSSDDFIDNTELGENYNGK